MDFLAFLVPSLWPNILKKITEIPTTSCQKSFLSLHFLHNFRTRNTRKLIKGSEDSHYSPESNKTLSHNIASLDWPITSRK